MTAVASECSFIHLLFGDDECNVADLPDYIRTREK